MEDRVPQSMYVYTCMTCIIVVLLRVLSLCYCCVIMLLCCYVVDILLICINMYPFESAYEGKKEGVDCGVWRRELSIVTHTFPSNEIAEHHYSIKLQPKPN